MVESDKHVDTLEPFMRTRGFIKVRQTRWLKIDHMYIHNQDVDELVPAEVWDPGVSRLKRAAHSKVKSSLGWATGRARLCR